MAIERIDPELCNGCGICVNTCIMDVIRMDEIHNKAVIQYGGDCMSCLCCEQECPTKAIYVSVFEKPHITSWG